MSNAGAFIRAMKDAVSQGNLNGDTERHLRYEINRIGWSGPEERHVAVVSEEIRRLERELGTLRELRAKVFGVV